MMRSALLWALAASACCACDAGVDVVARVPDAGVDAAKPAVTDPPANVAACGTPTSALAILSKVAAVTLFDASLRDLGVPAGDCPSPVPAAFAVDRAGRIWTTTGGKIVVSTPKTTGCDTYATDLEPSVMAFVWDPQAGTESLYAVAGGGLYVIDPKAPKPTFIGALSPALDEVRGLTGTADGWLLALAGDPLVTIAYVDTKTAVVKPLWQTKSPDPLSRFAGGAPTAKGFVLVFGASAWTFDTTTAALDAGPSLFSFDPGILAVAASPCATLGK
jgi:hypothetical protein